MNANERELEEKILVFICMYSRLGKKGSRMDANRREIEERLIYKEEVFKIIKCAICVSNNLGAGFLEAVYQEAMEIELLDNKINFESQKKIIILYKNKALKKEYIADFLCFDNIIVEIKAIKKITEIEEASVNKLSKGYEITAWINYQFWKSQIGVEKICKY